MKENFFLSSISNLALSYRKWILIGSLPIKLNNKKIANRSVLFNPKGRIQNYYDKMHMFDVKISKTEIYNESKKFLPGSKKVIANLPWGKLGMSICYDIRFPNMFREYAKKGAIFLTAPSAFTKSTGETTLAYFIKSKSSRKFFICFCSSANR